MSKDIAMEFSVFDHNLIPFSKETSDLEIDMEHTGKISIRYDGLDYNITIFRKLGQKEFRIEGQLSGREILLNEERAKEMIHIMINSMNSYIPGLTYLFYHSILLGKYIQVLIPKFGKIQ